MTDEEGNDPPKRGLKRTLTDVQRYKLEKLMKDPSKPVFIPSPRADPDGKDPNRAPDFVYNVMGSSAGAGSGEFHVYRQIRRKEMTRQRILDGRRRRDDLDQQFREKVKKNEELEAAKTAKKRAKRLKRKEKLKAHKRTKKEREKKSSESSEDDDEDEEEQEEEGQEGKDESNEKEKINNDEKIEAEKEGTK